MEPLKEDKARIFDDFYSNNNLTMLKIFSFFMNEKQRPMLAILIKYMELNICMQKSMHTHEIPYCTNKPDKELNLEEAIASVSYKKGNITYNSETFVYTLMPTQKLRYNSQYKIVFADELLSEDGSKALSGADVLFATEKYEISIASVNETAEGLRIYFAGAEAAQGEVVAVCAYNADGAMTDFDMAEGIVAGDITALLPNAAATDKIVIYLIDSAEGNYLYQLYQLN